MREDLAYGEVENYHMFRSYRAGKISNRSRAAGFDAMKNRTAISFHG